MNQMTLEAIESEVDDLRYIFDEIENKKESEVFCNGCCAIESTYEPEIYWGAPCRRPEPICPVDFEPGASGCHRGDVFEELEDAQAAILKEIGELESLDVAVFAETEVA